VYCFAGTRREQEHRDLAGYLAAVQGIEGVVCVGEKVGNVLAESLFASMFRPDAAIVLLYANEAYEQRHSGIVLEALACGSLVAIAEGDLAEHYAARGFRVRTFRDPRELRLLLEEARGGA